MEFWDDYEHIDPKVSYICENLKTREVECLTDDELIGCDCETNCSEKCPCVQRSGGKYTFTDKYNLNDYCINILHHDKPMYECNNNCKCQNVVCGHKVVQYGPRKMLKVVDTNKLNNLSDPNCTKGFGVITQQEINQGNFLCEYAGEVVTQAEVHKRFESYTRMKLVNNYVFCINENFGSRNTKTFIDPTFYGNIGRYINHSCEPNCILIPIRVHDDVPKLCIFAKQKIHGSNEITFDYGASDNKSRENNGSHTKCLCLSPNCRKYLPFDKGI